MSPSRHFLPSKVFFSHADKRCFVWISILHRETKSVLYCTISDFVRYRNGRALGNFFLVLKTGRRSDDDLLKNLRIAAFLQ